MTTYPCYEDVHVGDPIPALVKQPLTHLQLVRYAGASGDFNPLHTDPTIGEQIGVGGIIGHGMLTMGFLGQMLSNFVGSTALRSFEVSFKGMTHLHDVITCTGRITKIYEQDSEAYIAGTVQATDQQGEIKATGTFVATVPRRG